MPINSDLHMASCPLLMIKTWIILIANKEMSGNQFERQTRLTCIPARARYKYRGDGDLINSWTRQRALSFPSGEIRKIVFENYNQHLSLLILHLPKSLLHAVILDALIYIPRFPMTTSAVLGSLHKTGFLWPGPNFRKGHLGSPLLPTRVRRCDAAQT